MKKRALLLMLGLAIAAFFAPSPDAVRLVGERLHEDAAPRRAHVGKSLNAANAPGFAGQSADINANSGIGGNAIEHGTNPTEEGEKIVRAVAEVPDAELRQTLERSLHDDSPIAYRELLQRRWAEINPSAAATWASSLNDSTKALPLIQQTAIVWAAKDMQAAVQWADSLPQGELRTSAVMALGYEATRSLSFEALDLVTELEPSIERDTLLEHMVRQWGASDANQAVAWVKQVLDAALREQLLSAVATTAAQQNPAEAAALIASDLPSGPAQNRAAVEIVQLWAETDPASATAWVEQFPESEVKRAAEAALVTQ